MKAPVEDMACIARALHPPGAAPGGPEWNAPELRDVLPVHDAPTPAAVLVGLVPRPDALNVVLTVRNEDLRHHAGQVSFPGGRIEASDRDATQAALREASEEVGLLPTQAEPLGWLDPLLTITGFRVLPLVARISPEFVPAPDPREVARVFEVPLSYLLNEANLRKVPIEYRGRTRMVLEYASLPGAHPRIWGATASILHNFSQRLATVRAA